MTTEYQIIDTPVPPLLRVIDGALYVEVIHEHLTLRAPVGSGSYFFAQVVEKLVDPALKASYPRAEFVREEPDDAAQVR